MLKRAHHSVTARSAYHLVKRSMSLMAWLPTQHGADRQAERVMDDILSQTPEDLYFQARCRVQRHIYRLDKKAVARYYPAGVGAIRMGAMEHGAGVGCLFVELSTGEVFEFYDPAFFVAFAMQTNIAQEVLAGNVVDTEHREPRAVKALLALASSVLANPSGVEIARELSRKLEKSQLGYAEVGTVVETKFFGTVIVSLALDVGDDDSHVYLKLRRLNEEKADIRLAHAVKQGAVRTVEETFEGRIVSDLLVRSPVFRELYHFVETDLQRLVEEFAFLYSVGVLAVRAYAELT